MCFGDLRNCVGGGEGKTCGSDSDTGNVVVENGCGRGNGGGGRSKSLGGGGGDDGRNIVKMVKVENRWWALHRRVP